jgi:hypothetical protein
MKIKYDKSIDAVYVYFTAIHNKEVHFTYTCNPDEVKGRDSSGITCIPGKP